MKRLVIAAALALALPAFAAEEAEKTPAQPQPATAATPAPESPAAEKVATEGMSKDVTLEAGPAAESPVKSERERTLRFEDWAQQAGDEPFETQEEWDSHKK